jgi:hypothetical protein
MNYTDTQLKQTLTKMLPDTLLWDTETSQHNTDRPQDEGWGLCWDSGNPVLDTELLHLCWLVEELLIQSQNLAEADMTDPDYALWTRYQGMLKEVCPKNYGATQHATWQQRVIALAKVKGVEIVC